MAEPATPHAITIVGLGPGDPGLRTVAAQRALAGAARIILRTAIHPGLGDLAADPRVTSCDDLYEAGSDFQEVYEAIAERVLGAARTTAGPLVFAVPGHPRFGERSVRLVEARAAAAGIAVEVQGAVSALDAVANALGVDPFADGVQIVDALDLAGAVDREPFAGGSLPIDPARPCLLGQIYSPAIAGAVKLALSRLYPDDHEITLVHAAAVPRQESLARCPLAALDRQRVDHLTSLWLPALPPLEAVRSPLALQRIIARLRAPGGCPWDREQTHESIRGAVIEEAYETLDAIDAGDLGNLAEELGDLLLQVVLHAQIAEENSDFALEDIYEGTSRKLLRRHPHVFGDADARTADEVVATWEAVKASERAAGRPDQESTSAFDRLPRSMPALQRTIELIGPRLGAGLRGESEYLPSTAQAGEALLAAAEAAIVVGVDPERALGEALRRRFDRASAPASRA